MITSDGIDYYAYILIYVDDILILDNPEQIMILLKDIYTVKPSSIGEPKVYLGVDISKEFDSDDSYAWIMGSHTYLKEAIWNVKKQLSQYNLRFNKKLPDTNYSPRLPFSLVNYKSELATSMVSDSSQKKIFKI